MVNKTGNTDKKFTTTNKNAKTEEKYWNMLGRKEKSNPTIKINDTTQGDKSINQKVLVKKGRLKRYRESIKQ